MSECKYVKAVAEGWEYGVEDADSRTKIARGVASTMDEAMQHNGMAPLEGAICFGKLSVPSHGRQSLYNVQPPRLVPQSLLV